MIAQDAGVQLTGPQPQAPAQPQNEPQTGLSLGTIVLFIVIFFIVMATPLRSIVFAILFSSLFGGGRGSVEAIAAVAGVVVDLAAGRVWRIRRRQFRRWRRKQQLVKEI